MGSGWYLVQRGLLQHLRAQIGAELKFPAPKIAPGKEQWLHLAAHGGRGLPAKDQGPTKEGGDPGTGGVQLCSATRGDKGLTRQEPSSRLRAGKRKTTTNRTQP